MILDDKSRLIVGGRFFYQNNSVNFQKVLHDAVATYGIPGKLYVDNDSHYKNEQFIDALLHVAFHTYTTPMLLVVQEKLCKKSNRYDTATLICWAEDNVAGASYGGEAYV